ncbi:MAG: hypothetical protein AB1635_07930 [Acidobacteriota bacterium]
MSSKLHAVWPRTPGTRLRLSPSRPTEGRGQHVVEVLGACAGLAGEDAPLDVVYVQLPGGDDLFRLASRTGARLGPTGAVEGVRVREHGASPQEPQFADLGVVSVGAHVSPSEARAAARLACELACRRVLFVLPASSASAEAARAISDACRAQAPFAGVESGRFTAFGRQPDFVSVAFDEPTPEFAAAVALAA